MESIGSQGERMGEEAADEFEQEEDCVDDDHNLDPEALGPGDMEEAGHGDESSWATKTPPS